MHTHACMHTHTHTCIHARTHTNTFNLFAHCLRKFYTFLHPTSCKIHIGSGMHALKLMGPAADAHRFVVCRRKLRALWTRSCTHRRSSPAGARPWMKPGKPWCRVQRTMGERLILPGFSCSFLYHLLLNSVCVAQFVIIVCALVLACF